jgi:cysteine sulfinate desulfinase/cysteine desulfurase-like protein
MLLVKSIAAISNGSACTSESYELSHVLRAMGLTEDRVNGALRWSWCHITENVPLESIVAEIRSLRRRQTVADAPISLIHDDGENNGNARTEFSNL